MSWFIRDAYYRPRKFNFHKAPGPFPQNLNFGIEIEIEYRRFYDINDNEKAVKEATRFFKENRDFFYAKDDCSLDNGFEIVTHPFNYNWFIKNRHRIFEACLHFCGDYKAKRTCGLHIHMSRDYFNPNHLEKMFKLFYGKAGKKFFAQLGQRTRAQINEFSVFNEDEKEDHHSAVSLSERHNTVEFRFFQGTLNSDLIIANVQLLVAAVLYTKHVDCVENVSVGDFRSYLNNNFERFAHAWRLLQSQYRKKEYNWRAAG